MRLPPLPSGTATPPLTTVTLCRYAKGDRMWAFNRMGSARRELSAVPGLRFWKLLGTGEGLGFSLRPDFTRYGLLAVWESSEAAAAFIASSPLMEGYRRHAEEIWTVRLLPAVAHGAWSNCNPFLPVLGPQDDARPVAVLTRASIRPTQFVAFWKAVPATTRLLEEAPGLLLSVGTGEAPFIRPATFSIWRSQAEMRAFAYGTDEHRAVIQQRRDQRWYSEELFARFVPVGSEGTWNGGDPLAGLL